MINGIECYNPVPESEVEERTLKYNEEIFASLMADILMKYASRVDIDKDDTSVL